MRIIHSGEGFAKGVTALLALLALLAVPSPTSAQATGGDGHSVVVDFGGGALGSVGNNRFIGNEKGAIRITRDRIAAQYNWWGGAGPTIHNSVDEPHRDSSVEFRPVLAADPR